MFSCVGASVQSIREKCAMPSVQSTQILGRAQRHGPWRDKQSLRQLRAWVTQVTQVTGGAVGVSIVFVEHVPNGINWSQRGSPARSRFKPFVGFLDVFFGWVLVSVHELRF